MHTRESFIRLRVNVGYLFALVILYCGTYATYGLVQNDNPSQIIRASRQMQQQQLARGFTSDRYTKPSHEEKHPFRSFSFRLCSVTESYSSADLNNNVQKLQNCVCLVTGASRGIGKGIALELGSQGATVYVTGTSTSKKKAPSTSERYATSPEVGGPGTIEETAREITRAGGRGIALYCNHAMDEDVETVMDRIAADYGRLDILVNNCFRLPPGGAQRLYNKFWEEGSIEVWDTLHTIGLRSHFIATVKAMPLLLQSASQKTPSSPYLPRPLIAMISSFGGLSYTFNVPYGVGKAAVDRLAKDMAVELTPQNICVTSFWPGIVSTERTIASVESGDWEKHVGIPLENAESPQFTGRAIVAVATDGDNLQKKTGTFQVVAELAQEYGFTDINGRQPPSIRSLRFLLPSYAFDEQTREKIPQWMIPDWKLPFWVMAGGRPPKPEEQQ